MDSPANSPVEPLELGKKINKATVELLYTALACSDTSTVASILAEDLEWWFHGPPGCQHMMRVLTGGSLLTGFRFAPRSLSIVGNMVCAEGWEGEHAYWVHVWTVQDGMITQFREYFNTWLTVQDLRPLLSKAGKRGGPTLWQSEPLEHSHRSLPGLILAI